LTTEIAATSAGLVRGAIERDGIVVFRGIPFAAPPTGELRFAPPAPVTAWEGERAAIDFGPSSLQNVDPLSMVIPGAERIYYPPRTGLFAEDCLYLNVCTPGVDDEARPVLVWIHGGGYMTGSGSAEWYDGTNLALKNDVVIVTFNYRLGILGGLFLGDIDSSAANFGLRDQVAALDWVRCNISQFGGDPQNVTIFGQSAGGMAVGSLLISPLSRGLFQRAIMQSGNVANFFPLSHAEWTKQRILEALQIEPGNVLAELRDVSILRLLEVQRTMRQLMFPVLDDMTIPADPLDTVRQGRAADVPMMIGNTAAEDKLFHLTGMPVPEPGFDLRAGLEDLLGAGSSALAARAAELYRHGSALADADLWDLAISDARRLLPSRQLADAHASAGRPTFMFEFAIESTARGGTIGAAHEIDVPFVFDALDKKGVDDLLGSDLVADPAVRKLAGQVGAAWATFARDGEPKLDSMPSWPRYEQNARATVILDRIPSVSLDHHRDRLDFWEAHCPAYPLAVPSPSPGQ
jgi:para-nitrobenzyl esterase